MNKNQTAAGLDSEDDSDDYDVAEANCELAMVKGQLCSIPYELFDLPDLTGILSVETWNSFLTEEERFFLSCFLPDMDQETFCLTMRELLAGASLYFGNPVDTFYMKLRGGLFTPKAACCKEGIMFVKRRMYYYSLKFYHEKMIRRFTEMQRLWDQYGEELGKKARLLLWSERAQTGNLKHSMERRKSVTSHRSGGSKDTLRIKISKKGIFRYHGSSLVSSGHQHQTLPKGLLKIVPKSSPAILGEPYVSPENDLLQTHESGSKSTRFRRKPYGTIACSITELPRCLLNHQGTSSTYLETTRRSSIEETEPVLHDPTRTIPFGASTYSITEHSLPTMQEEYVHYHLKSPGSETMETNKALYGKNFQREANVLRKPLHARESDDDHLFSLTYKRRKVQGIGVA